MTRGLMEKAVDRYKMYDLFPYDYKSQKEYGDFCKLFGGLFCKEINSLYLTKDPSIDMAERFDVFQSYDSAGACYRNALHFASNADHKEETFARYDYNSDELNMEHYN